MGSIAGICREYHWPPDFVIHELTLAQAFAFSACSAWSNGMEPVNGGYTDWELERQLQILTKDQD